MRPAIIGCGAIAQLMHLPILEELPGLHIAALCRVGDDVPVKVEIAFGAQYEWWDEWLAVHGEREEVRIDSKNPMCATRPPRYG